VNTVDLNLLPIALALYDEQTVSRAAKRLGMSQPAVSMALRRLRDRFDPAVSTRPFTFALSDVGEMVLLP
jgi:DNA-binding transcriptional LysR family regulator